MIQSFLGMEMLKSTLSNQTLILCTNQALQMRVYWKWTMQTSNLLATVANMFKYACICSLKLHQSSIASFSSKHHLEPCFLWGENTVFLSGQQPSLKSHLPLQLLIHTQYLHNKKTLFYPSHWPTKPTSMGWRNISLKRLSQNPYWRFTDRT